MQGKDCDCMATKSRLIQYITTGVMLAVFLFSGCTPHTALSGKKEKILKVGLLPDVNSLPFLVAKQEGYFDEEKVKVEIISFKSAVDRDAALQSRSIDGCVSDLLAAAFLEAGGFDVAVTSVTDGGYILLAGPHTSIQSIEDFEGQSIAVSENTIIEYAADRMLEMEGLDRKDIKMTYIPTIAVRLEMLQQGKIQGACLPEPLATLSVTRGSRVIEDSQKKGLPPSVMVFHQKIVQEYTEEMKALYRAYDKAAQALNERGDDFREMLVDEAGFPEEVKDIIQFPDYESAHLPKKEQVDEVLDWMRDRDLLKEDLASEDLLVDILE